VDFPLLENVRQGRIDDVTDRRKCSALTARANCVCRLRGIDGEVNRTDDLQVAADGMRRLDLVQTSLLLHRIVAGRRKVSTDHAPGANLSVRRQR
jgi:hypothetical protein